MPIIKIWDSTYDIDGAADAGDPDKFGHGETIFSAFGDNLFFLLRRALKSDVGGFSFRFHVIPLILCIDRRQGWVP